MSVIDLARRFIGALEAGDVEATRACFQPDAGIWHNYDGKTQTVEENLAVLRWMIGRFPSRRYEIRRLEAIEGGYLQQHTLRLTSDEEQEVAAEAIAVVTVRDDRIARIEEYLDPAPITKLGSRS